MPPILTRRAMEDVVMTDAYLEEYERDIPMFNGESGDVESIIDRLKRYFGRHKKYSRQCYISLRTTYMEQLRRSTKWTKYSNKGMNSNHNDWWTGCCKSLKSERILEEVKITIFKIKHEWGKAYEYLSEFIRLSRILQFSDETKRLLLIQQVRPSVREAFYDLAAEKQTLEGYVTCLKRCDTFLTDFKDEYIERYEYNLERKITIMSRLEMMDPPRPSKDIEAKRRRNSDNQQGDKRDFNRK